MTDAATDDIDPAEDERIAMISDFLDGALDKAQAAEVEQKIKTDEAWKQTHADMVSTKEALSGVLKARAPETFEADITSTIHKRSAGRFFAKRTLGDRVPFTALLIVAGIGLLVIGYVLWTSSTGSLKVDRKPAEHKTEKLVPVP